MNNIVPASKKASITAEPRHGLGTDNLHVAEVRRHEATYCAPQKVLAVPGMA